MLVLVVSTPGLGHVHPLAPFAASLQAAGHEVVWVTGPDGVPRVTGLGFRAESAGLSTPERMARLQPFFPPIAQLPPRERRLPLFSILFGRIAATAMAVDMAPIIDTIQPELIIGELAELASLPLAAARRIPHVTVGFSGGLDASIVAAARDETAGLWTAEGLTGPDDLGLYDHLYLHPFAPSMGQRPQSAAVRSVQPGQVDGSATHVRPDWIDNLGRDRPLVYVTFGTEVAAQAPWRSVIDGLSQLDVDALLTVGGQLDVTGLGPVPDHIRVERYVPQSYVLEKSALVISHGGAGTLLAAAVRGLPQLLMPIAADQWDNADALTSAGAGITLELDQRSPEFVGSRVAGIIDGHLRESSVALAQEFAELPEPSTFVNTFEALVADNR